MSTQHAEAEQGVRESDGDEAARRAAELEALRRMAVEAADTVSPEEIFRAVCVCAAEVLHADFAAVQLHLFDETRLWCADRAPAREVATRLFERMEQAGRGGRPLAVGAVAADAGLDEDQCLPPAFGAGTALALPLSVGEGGGALLVGWHHAEPPSARTVALAATLGEQAAAAFRNAARYDALLQAAVRRDRFFSAMSHDLRTPITAIVGYSELLQDGIMGELAARQQEMVERISQVSGHLSQLVNDILDLAKLDAGRMEFHLERVSLGGLVDEAIVAVAPQARSKGLELRLEIDARRAAPLWVDPPRVRQVLVNLLSNAVKFTDRGSVRVTAGTEDDGREWIEVRDTGPGLPPGAEEAVFEEFLQLAAGNKTKREPGSGLGLAISRRLARAMGGDLTARAAGRDAGAVFRLTLPPPPEDESPDPM